MENPRKAKDFNHLRNTIEKQIQLQGLQRDVKFTNSDISGYCIPIRLPLKPQKNVPILEKSDNLGSQLECKVTGKTFQKLMEILRKEKLNDETNIDTIYDYLPTDVLSIKLTVKQPKSSNEINTSNKLTSKVVNNYEEICTPTYHSVLCEILESEHIYITNLDNFYHNYILYFKRERFSHLSNIYPFFTIIEEINYNQAQFYKKLKTCINIEDVVSHFLENEKLFASYRNYILNLNTAQQFLTIKHRFDVLHRQNELSAETPFEDHLLSPLQRLNKYVFLFQKLENNLQEKWRQSSKITAVLLIFKRLLESLKSDSIIVDSILDRPLTLVNFGSYIMQQSFNIKKISPNTQTIVFLFQEVIVFTIKRGSHHFTYAHSILMKDLYIRAISDVPHAFELMDFHTSKNKNGRSEKIVFVLENTDQKTKDLWIEVIESLLWDQLMACKSNS